MPADVIVYAVVAAGLVFWLRSILGTRHGEERERPNPYSSENYKKSEGKQPYQDLMDENGPKILQNGSKVAFPPGSIYSVENKTAENEILDMAERYKDFDIHFFMHGAQEAFRIIVEAFASGDKETLRDLLEDDVYTAFSNAIDERQKAGETLETKIQKIRKAQIMEAHGQDSTTYITLRFVADEISVHKDGEGRILAGDPEQVSEIIDIWTFGRDMSSTDPRWFLIQTRSDDPEDNDTIPNSH